jgi:hypothetical protein
MPGAGGRARTAGAELIDRAGTSLRPILRRAAYLIRPDGCYMRSAPASMSAPSASKSPQFHSILALEKALRLQVWRGDCCKFAANNSENSDRGYCERSSHGRRWQPKDREAQRAGVELFVQGGGRLRAGRDGRNRHSGGRRLWSCIGTRSGATWRHARPATASLVSWAAHKDCASTAERDFAVDSLQMQHTAIRRFNFRLPGHSGTLTQTAAEVHLPQ